MADRGIGTVKINAINYNGLQENTSIITTESSSTLSGYASVVGKTAPSYGIIATTNDNPYQRGVAKLSPTNYNGLQTGQGLITQDGNILSSSNSYVSSLGKSSPSSGFFTPANESYRGNDPSTAGGAANTVTVPYASSYLSSSLQVGVKYYAMWGLENITNTPRTWVVKNQPDTDGTQSGYSMNASTIRIINSWAT